MTARARFSPIPGNRDSVLTCLPAMNSRKSSGAAASAALAAARLSTPRTRSSVPCTLSGQTLRLRWLILRTAVKALWSSVPHELADPLDRRGILGDELDGDRVPDVAPIGPWQVLRGVHHLYLDRGRIEREMHRNPRRNLLHQPPSKDVIFGVRLEHRI